MSVSGNTVGINKWERITPKRELSLPYFHSKCEFTRLYIKGNKSVSSIIRFSVYYFYFLHISSCFVFTVQNYEEKSNRAKLFAGITKNSYFCSVI